MFGVLIVGDTFFYKTNFISYTSLVDSVLNYKKYFIYVLLIIKRGYL